MKVFVRVLWFVTVVAGIAALGAHIRSNNLNSSLREAVNNRQPQLARELIRSGADPNAPSNGYGSVLVEAADRGQPQTVKILLAAGASVGMKGPGGCSPAMAVALSSTMSEADARTILQLLHAKGENLEERDDLGCTPLLRAVWSGHAPAVRVLLDMGADIHTKNDLGQDVWFWEGRIPTASAEIDKILRGRQAIPPAAPNK